MARIIGPGDLIVASWDNFRKNFHAYAEMVVWIVVLSVVQWTLTEVLRDTIPNQSIRLAYYMMLSVPGGLAFLAVTAAMIDITVRGLQGRRIDTRESLHHGFHRLLSLLWVSIISTIAVFTGFIALIVPGILFSVWFKFAPYHTVSDDVGGLPALAASRRLVTGRFWAVVWRIVLPTAFFMMLVAFAESLVFFVLGSMYGDPHLFFGKVSDPDQLSRLHTLTRAVVPQIIEGFALALFLGADIALWLELKKKG